MKFIIPVLVMVALFGAFQSVQADELNCSFGDFLYWYEWYTCRVGSFDNSDDNRILSGSTGNHEPNKEDSDVKMLFIHKTSVNFIPENIGLLFNLKGFAMRFCELIQIRSKDFYGMNHVEFVDLGVNTLTVLPSNAFSALPNLLSIDLSYNQIEQLPKSLFCNNVKLKTVLLIENKIKFIGSTIFDRTTKLEEVNLKDNVCVSKIYKDDVLSDLKREIKQRCQK